MIHKNFIAFSAVFFLVILSGSIVGLYYYEESFKNTFFPEVFGFALEGLLIFTGLSSVQLYLAAEKTKKEELQKINSLREIASGFVSYASLIIEFHDKKQARGDFLCFKHKTIENLHGRLIAIAHKDQNINFEDLVKEIKVNKSIYDSGLVISAQINSKALTSWKQFVKSLNSVVATNKISTKEVIDSLEALTWLGEYAEAKSV